MQKLPIFKNNWVTGEFEKHEVYLETGSHQDPSLITK